MSWIIRAMPKLDIFAPLREPQVGDKVRVQEKDQYDHGVCFDMLRDLKNDDYIGTIVAIKPELDHNNRDRIDIAFGSRNVWAFTFREVVQ